MLIAKTCEVKAIIYFLKFTLISLQLLRVFVFLIEIFVSLKEKTMESHYKNPQYSPNPATDKLLKDWYKDNKPSETQNAVAELCKKASKERWELIAKTIESLPTRYDSISCGATVNLGGESKTPYFGRKYFTNESEYIFTTVEWYENTFNANTYNNTMHFKIIYEPQDDIFIIGF